MKSLLVLGVLVGCSNDPAPIAGDYTVGVTNRDNGCNFANWTVGNMTAGVDVKIAQSGASVTADVTGGVGAVLDVAFGASAFTGVIDGNQLDLTLEGTRVQQSGTCTYTYNGEILATANGDILTGRINYTPATNGNSDCAAVAGCLTYQEFNGSRPPQ
ncbi:MAG: hypothetical protein ABI467_15330 [Kofleriaceae bacterium]